MKNVLEVDQSGLCLECGTCEGVCPHKNVKLIPDESGRNRVHILDDSHCAKCPGICLKACPGHEIDMDQLNLQVFGKLPENYWAGNYKQAFLGYSPDEVIQKTSASGGIVSMLLIHALETGMIQGVYLLTPQSGKPFELTAALATDAEAVLAAAGSVYWPAPIGQCLREILHSDGKYAFVGLPCEIQALRKAQKVYQQLNDKIAFAIGIYCGGRTTIAGQRFAFSRYGIELDEVAEIKYRQPEWPGHLKVTLKDGGEVHVYKPQQLQGFSGQIFGAPRCIYCNDAIADLSDISTGDAIRLEGFRNPEEKSILVARTKVGLELLEAARRANKLVLREVPIEKLVHSQHRPILHKKLALWARLKVAKKLFGKAVPKITMTAPDGAIKLKPVFFTAGARIILMGDLTSKPFFRKLLKIVPMRWLKKYSNFEIYS
ncbi:MAG: Coenzyme F420 hydrogenase/dehydrogenase, beta subunit C-terminal domain [Anaerolineaceae bacterium]|nr:Coenzyme F420 hydrogenase/dehydrogenase, beta subunit C-terminal domain [Anaerolineaceae bacterium]